VTDANELRQRATQQKQAFEEKFGYPAGEVPGIWVGQQVTVNMLGGRGGDRQLAPTTASGMLEAISLDGVDERGSAVRSTGEGRENVFWYPPTSVTGLMKGTPQGAEIGSF